MTGFPLWARFSCPFLCLVIFAWWPEFHLFGWWIICAPKHPLLWEAEPLLGSRLFFAGSFVIGLLGPNQHTVGVEDTLFPCLPCLSGRTAPHPVSPAHPREQTGGGSIAPWPAGESAAQERLTKSSGHRVPERGSRVGAMSTRPKGTHHSQKGPMGLNRMGAEAQQA